MNFVCVSVSSEPAVRDADALEFLTSCKQRMLIHLPCAPALSNSFLYVQTMSTMDEMAARLGMQVDSVNEDEASGAKSTSIGSSRRQTNLQRFATAIMQLGPRRQIEAILKQHRIYVKMHSIVQQEPSLVAMAAVVILCTTPEMRTAAAREAADDEEEEEWLDGVTFDVAQKKLEGLNIPLVERDFRKRYDTLFSDFGRCIQSNSIADPADKLSADQIQNLRDAVKSMGETMRGCRAVLLLTLSLPTATQPQGQADMLRLDFTVSTAENIRRVELMVAQGMDIAAIIERKGMDEEGNVAIIPQAGEGEEEDGGGAPGGVRFKKSILEKVNQAVDYLVGIMTATGCKLMDDKVWTLRPGHMNVYEPWLPLQDWMYAQVPRDIQPTMWGIVLQNEHRIMQALRMSVGCAPRMEHDDTHVAFPNGTLNRDTLELRTDCTVPTTVYVDHECRPGITDRAKKLLDDGITYSDPRLHEWQREVEQFTPALSQLGQTQDFEVNDTTRREHAFQDACAEGAVNICRRMVGKGKDTGGHAAAFLAAMEEWQLQEAIALSTLKGFAEVVGSESESMQSLRNLKRDGTGGSDATLLQHQNRRNKRLAELLRQGEAAVPSLDRMKKKQHVPPKLCAVVVDQGNETEMQLIQDTDDQNGTMFCTDSGGWTRAYIARADEEVQEMLQGKLVLFATGDLSSLQMAYKVTQHRARQAYSALNEALGTVKKVFGSKMPSEPRSAKSKLHNFTRLKLRDMYLPPRFCRWCAYHMHGCSPQHMSSMRVPFGAVMQVQEEGDGGKGVGRTVTSYSWIPHFEPWWHFEKDCKETRSGRNLLLFILGFAQYPAQKYMRTDRVAFLPGASGAGKSSLLDALLQGYRPTGVMTLSARGDDRFTFQRAAEIAKGNAIQLCVVPDADHDMKLALADFLSMATCDRMNAAVKGEKSVEFTWTSAMIVLQNAPPAFLRDRRGNVLRRILPLTFIRSPHIVDATLSERLKTEFPTFLVAGILMFRAMANEARQSCLTTGRPKGWEGVAPVCFFRNIVEFSADLHPIIAFIERNRDNLYFGNMESAKWAGIVSGMGEEELEEEEGLAGDGSGGGGDGEGEEGVVEFKGSKILHSGIESVAQYFQKLSHKEMVRAREEASSTITCVHMPFDEFKRAVDTWKKSQSDGFRGNHWGESFYQGPFSKNGIRVTKLNGVETVLGIALKKPFRDALFKRRGGDEDE